MRGSVLAGDDDFSLHQLEKNVPPRLAEAGIKRLRWGVIMLHRPWCMWGTESHARRAHAEDLNAWAEDELRNLEAFVFHHKTLTEMGVPVLVMTLSELMWRPYIFHRRYQDFAPCLPPLNLWRGQRMGIDIFEVRQASPSPSPHPEYRDPKANKPGPRPLWCRLSHVASLVSPFLCGPLRASTEDGPLWLA